MRSNPDSPEIEAIRVPARLDRNVGMSSLVRMSLAGPVQQTEFVVIQNEEMTS